MAHANAALTPKHRLRLARLIVDEGWTPARAAEFFNVTWRTADKWAKRYRDEGPAGMVDRSSARHTQPARRSEEHTSELQSHVNLVCRLLLEKKKKKK